jgi:hypothetical protein
VTDDTGTNSAVAATTVTVTAVNDAPTLTAPAGLRGLPGAPVVISGIVFSDVDGGNGIEAVTLNATSTGSAQLVSFTALADASVTATLSPGGIVLTGQLPASPTGP